MVDKGKGDSLPKIAWIKPWLITRNYEKSSKDSLCCHSKHVIPLLKVLPEKTYFGALKFKYHWNRF